MDQDIQKTYADSVNSSHMASNSLHYDKNSAAFQGYNVPPPNITFAPYNNYTAINPTPFISSPHMNFLVPSYPPPNFQNNSFSPTNYVPVFQPHSDISKPFEHDLQYCCTQQETVFNSIPSVNESNSDTFERNGLSVDSLWIERWLSDKVEMKAKIVPEKLEKISEAKRCFKKCITLLQDLQLLKEKMHANYKDMGVETWSSLCQSFLDMKSEVADQVLKLPDITNLKKTIEKRRKKRECQHRRNKRKKEVKAIKSENRQVLHHKIDTWLKLMQGTIDHSKREESLKKEADGVLSEVLRKKADGRRQLALVEALLKLRQLRAKSAVSQGQPIQPEYGIRFEKVAENLKALWNKQLLEYNVEEQGMRVMLSEAVDERDQSRVTRERHILSQWDKLLFGTRSSDFPEFYLAAEESVESFINIRHSWDKLTASSEASVQSNIPVGWILPSNPSSSNWESLLSPEKTNSLVT